MGYIWIPRAHHEAEQAVDEALFVTVNFPACATSKALHEASTALGSQISYGHAEPEAKFP